VKFLPLRVANLEPPARHETNNHIVLTPSSLLTTSQLRPHNYYYIRLYYLFSRMNQIPLPTWETTALDHPILRFTHPASHHPPKHQEDRKSPSYQQTGYMSLSK